MRGAKRRDEKARLRDINVHRRYYLTYGSLTSTPQLFLACSSLRSSLSFLVAGSAPVLCRRMTAKTSLTGKL